MNEKVTGSLADSRESNGISLVVDNIRSTPYVDSEVLEKMISEKLAELEKQPALCQAELADLSDLIYMLPSQAALKESYRTRLASLERLLLISNEIKSIELLGDEKKHPKLAELAALLEVTNHGPLRNLLEEEINYYTSGIKAGNQTAVSYENMAECINEARTSEEIEEVLCELFIEEYVDLHRQARKVVAKQLLNHRGVYHATEEVISKLKYLINQLNNNEEYYPFFEEAGEQAVTNGDIVHKRTITLQELKSISRA